MYIQDTEKFVRFALGRVFYSVNLNLKKKKNISMK